MCGVTGRIPLTTCGGLSQNPTFGLSLFSLFTTYILFWCCFSYFKINEVFPWKVSLPMHSHMKLCTCRTRKRHAETLSVKVVIRFSNLILAQDVASNKAKAWVEVRLVCWNADHTWEFQWSDVLQAWFYHLWKFIHHMSTVRNCWEVCWWLHHTGSTEHLCFHSERIWRDHRHQHTKVHLTCFTDERVLAAVVYFKCNKVCGDVCLGFDTTVGRSRPVPKFTRAENLQQNLSMGDELYWKGHCIMRIC